MGEFIVKLELKIMLLIRLIDFNMGEFIVKLERCIPIGTYQVNFNMGEFIVKLEPNFKKQSQH